MKIRIGWSYSLSPSPHLCDTNSVYSFKPERWLDPSAEMQLAYIPFGGGPRSTLLLIAIHGNDSLTKDLVCIGIHLAYTELRLTTAAFFRAFKVLQCTEQ